MRILVAVDGSECSLQALEILESLPIDKTELTLLSIVENISTLIHTDASTFGAEELYQELQEEAVGTAREILAEQSHRLEELGISATTTIRIGHPAEEILAHGEEIEAELIVVGAHGVRGWQRFFLGSVSRAVSESAKCPVLIGRPIGGEDPEAWRARLHAPEPSKVLLAWDGSASVRLAAELLTSWNEGKGGWAEIQLVHVRPLIKMFRMDLRQRVLPTWESGAALLQKNMGEAAKRLEATGFTTTTDLFESKDIAEALIRIATDEKTDLCVIGRSGKGFLKRGLLGSVASGLANRAPCSVLIGPAVPVEPTASTE